MCHQKNASLAAAGNGEVELTGLSVNIHVDKVVIKGTGNVQVAAREDGNRQHDNHRDNRHDQDRRQHDRSQARQAEAQQQALQAVQKALKQLSHRLDSLARHQKQF